MFGAIPDTDKAGPPVSRRVFLVTGAAAVAGAALLLREHPDARRLAKENAIPTAGPPVKIVIFSDAGERLRTMSLTPVVKSAAAWKKQLSGGSYDVARLADTEIAYTGKLWNQHAAGLYRCICCNTAVFSSVAKYDSGTGWPSFTAPIAPENIVESPDSSFGMERTAVACRLCNGHLGHVFSDGPPPTGMRYCMNSASLRFVAFKTA